MLVTAKCVHNILLGGKLCDIFNSVVSHSRLLTANAISPTSIYKYITTEQEKKKPHQEHNT